MVSGGYKGASININDWIVIGAIALAGYFAWKTFFKPTSKITDTISDSTGELGQTFDASQNLLQAGLNKVTSAIESIGTKKTEKSNLSNLQPVKTSSLNYVTKVIPAGNIYGNVPTYTVSTSKGKSTTIAGSKNTFYSNLGIGFDSKGAGYSSLTPLKR